MGGFKQPQSVRQRARFVDVVVHERLQRRCHLLVALAASPIQDALHSILKGERLSFEEALQLRVFSHLQNAHLRKL